MNKIMTILKSNPVVYVTRDIERSLGLNPATPGYFIISNYTDFGKQVSEGLDNVLLIKEGKILATWELLEHPQVIEFINSIPHPAKSSTVSSAESGSLGGVLVFKNTPKIERTCEEHNWKLLNPKAKLSSEVEEKMSQFEWLKKNDLDKYLPKTEVKLCSEFEWKGEPFILQFNRAHTGTGTIFIEQLEQLEQIKKKFPKREARISEYVNGPSFTNNNVVTADKILLGNVNYQITGLEPFTNNPFSTVGNDWGVVKKILGDKEIERYKEIAVEVGEKLKAEGWRGLFGVDINFDKSGKAYLIEINARQPASTTYESQLQQISGSADQQVSTFEAHLLSLLDVEFDEDLIKIKDGAQIIQRVTEKIPSLPEPKIYKASNFTHIQYNNTKPGSDLMRIMFPVSIMKGHNEFNDQGLVAMTFVLVTKNKGAWNQPRGSVIFIKDGKILLVKRFKYGLAYYEIPGGSVEDGEEIKDGAIREGKEETNLNFDITDREPIVIKNKGRDEHYFFAENIEGKPELVGEEVERNHEKDSYELVWLELKKLSKIKLIPEGLVKKILNSQTTKKPDNKTTLSPQALAVIENYLHLPFANQDINCPYFNNRRNKVRGGLRVMIGKGGAKEIVEEVKLLTLREKVDLKNLDNDGLKKFMVEHNIGVDCSGFVYHVLNAEFNGDLKKHLQFDLSFFRKIIAKFRTAENTGVKTLIASSKKIKLKDVKPGDIITMVNNEKTRDHVLIVHEVDYLSPPAKSSTVSSAESGEMDEVQRGLPKTIHYTHSFEWSTDGRYNHGVRQGEIEVVDPDLDILNQDWIEQGKTGKNNETYQQASEGKTEIRRIKK